jgi:Regulator of chromosome condensation (RCC1) repeat
VPLLEAQSCSEEVGRLLRCDFEDDDIDSIFSRNQPRNLKLVAGGGHFLIHSLPAASNETSQRSRRHQLWSLGDNRFQQLGRAERRPSKGKRKASNGDGAEFAIEPVRFFSQSEGFPGTIKKVVAGLRHTLALTTDGDVYGWGYNADGQVGLAYIGEDGHGREPQAVISRPLLLNIDGEGGEVEDISCGHDHSVAVLKDGSVWVTGSSECAGLRLNYQSRFASSHCGRLHLTR